jgi:hypothetical protein
MRFVKPERLWLKDHPELTERWVQQQIAENPALLGLGDLVLRDKERPQPRAGRLDLLLQDPETDRRYEVEIQLGRSDESHIIRTIEYWDIERKRYPQYDHCAVIVAEDITARFLNVIQLLNGSIPLIAIQMTALRVGDGATLLFTTVLDEMTRGAVDEDEAVRESTDRAYWEQRGTKATLAVVDELLMLVREVRPSMDLKYNKFYIGLAEDNEPDNFVFFRPRKEFVIFAAHVPADEETERLVSASGVETMPYDKRWGNYRLRLEPGDVKKYEGILRELIQRAHSANRS